MRMWLKTILSLVKEGDSDEIMTGHHNLTQAQAAADQKC